MLVNAPSSNPKYLITYAVGRARALATSAAFSTLVLIPFPRPSVLAWMAGILYRASNLTLVLALLISVMISALAPVLSSTLTTSGSTLISWLTSKHTMAWFKNVCSGSDVSPRSATSCFRIRQLFSLNLSAFSIQNSSDLCDGDQFSLPVLSSFSNSSKVVSVVTASLRIDSSVSRSLLSSSSAHLRSISCFVVSRPLTSKNCFTSCSRPVSTLSRFSNELTLSRTIFSFTASLATEYSVAISSVYCVSMSFKACGMNVNSQIDIVA